MKAAGRAAQTTAQPPQTTKGFRPIILHSGQSFPGAGSKSNDSGVIFSGHTADLESLDNLMRCRGSYCLRNSQHDGIAGVTDDGRVLFGVNSRINGQDTTVMGAFDKAGQPSPPTLKEQNLLGNLLPPSKSRLVLDTKTRSDLGVKFNGENTNVAVYAGRHTITFDLSHLHNFNDKTSLGVDASATANHKTGKVESRSLGLRGKSGDFDFRTSVEQAGLTTTGIAELRKGNLFGNIKYSTDGNNQTREFSFGANLTKSATMTVSLRPDYRPPKNIEVEPFKFDPANPTPLQNHTNAKIELKISF